MQLLNLLKQTLVITSTLALILNPLATSALAAPSLPSAPAAPDAPEAPNTPDAPDNPEEPETPDSTEEPETPTLPGEEEPVAEETPVEEEAPAAAEEETPSEGAGDSTETEAAAASGDESGSGAANSPTTTSTGGESGGSEVGESTIETGDADAVIGVTTQGNINESGSECVSCGGEAVTIGNSDNGAGSDNNNSVNLSSDDVLVQDNNAEIGNDVIAGTDSGHNSNSRNVGDSSTTTGDANTVATIITQANTNAEGVLANEFNIYDDYTGDIVLDVNNPCQTGCQAGEVIVLNQGNGTDSTNSNELNAVEANQTFQNNDATLDNNVVLTANSGHNTSSSNTGGDTDITTGDANVVANVVTMLNNNIAGNVVVNTVNVLGNLVGDIIAPEGSYGGCDSCSGDGAVIANSGNGADSDNTNTFTSADENLVIQDNVANINNGLDILADTGDNDVNSNTGGNSSVETGDTNVDVNVLNIANQNIVSDDWWIVLVNEAGNWVGHIVGAPEGANMGGSEGTEFVVNADGTITVANSGNGAGSTNNNDVSNTSSNTLVQTNNADVNNNIQLAATTGNNNANRNTNGDNTITTGDANVVANLVNFINNNIAGDANVVITIVNVLGSWTGNFVGPDQEQEAAAFSNNSSSESAIGGYMSDEQSGEVVTGDSSIVSNIANNAGQNAYYAGTSYNQPRQTSFGSSSGNGEQATLAGSALGITDDIADAVQAVASDKVKIVITWPMLITAALGIAYAGMRTRRLLFA